MNSGSDAQQGYPAGALQLSQKQEGGGSGGTASSNLVCGAQQFPNP